MTKRELLKLIDELNETIDRLKKSVDIYEKKYDAIQADLKKLPEGCVLGMHCRVCEFGKTYRINYGSCYETIRICGKADACQHFVKRGDVRDDKD